MKTKNNKNLKIRPLLSALTIGVGIVLMAGKMYTDSEPGAIPLLMIVLGVGGYLVTRAQIRA